MTDGEKGVQYIYSPLKEKSKIITEKEYKQKIL